MSRMTLRMALAAIVAAVSTTSARANFVDTFLVPSPADSQSVSVSSPFSRTDAVSATLNRTAAATLTTNGITGSSVTLGEVGGTGVFSLGLGSAAVGSASLTYTYTAPTNLSGAGTDFILTFVQADLNVPFSVTLRDNAAGVSTQNTTASSGGGIYTFSMSSFGGVDLANVTSIEILLNSGAGSVPSADFTLTSAEINTPTPPAVPAPPAVILALAAVPALGLTRLLRRKAAV